MLSIVHIQTLNLQETQKEKIGIKDTLKKKQKKKILYSWTQFKISVR